RQHAVRRGEPAEPDGRQLRNAGQLRGPAGIGRSRDRHLDQPAGGHAGGGGNLRQRAPSRDGRADTGDHQHRPVGGQERAVRRRQIGSGQTRSDQPVQPGADQHHRRDGRQLDVRPDHEPVGVHADHAVHGSVHVLERGHRGSRGHRGRLATETLRHRVKFLSVSRCFDRHRVSRPRRVNAETAELAENKILLRVLRVLRCSLWIVAAGISVAAQPSPTLGRISFPTSGSPQAQPAFLRGVLLLHSFEYDDAIASFRDAQKVDPGFVLAYWGEALCYNQPLWLNENLDKARATLGRLAASREARQAKATTAREKGYLDAVERLFGDGAKPARDRAYADRMAQLHAQFPEDDEAATFYALALLSTIPPGERNLPVSLKAGEIALAVLKRNPEHPGANHYALHSFDDGEHASRALQAAKTYARIAPASSHARHMPSHVFLPLGMWDEAVASDESAFAASVAFAKRKGLSPSQYDF